MSEPVKIDLRGMEMDPRHALLFSTLFGLAVAVFITLILIPLMGLSAGHLWTFILTFIFSGLTFSFLGIVIPVGVKEVFEAITMSNFFRFPLIFLCGVECL